MFNFWKKKPVSISKAMELVADYGDYLDTNPVGLEIVDESELPHNKKEILDAIFVCLPNVTDEKLQKALLSSALALANFQPNIGRRLHPLGIDLQALDPSVSTQDLAKTVLSNPNGKRRYDELRPVITQEIREIGERFKLVNKDL